MRTKRLYTLFLLLLIVLASTAQSCPDNNHPHAIDLGLPSGTKWACCNVGAKVPQEDGGYYAWGEINEKQKYTWETYIHCNGSVNTCTNMPDIQGTANDVAKARMGSSWNMPTSAQFDELKYNTAQNWVYEINGVKANGIKFTGTNGNCIVLPAAGYKTGISILKGDKLAKYGPNFYWTSQENSYYHQAAKTFWFVMLQSDTGRDIDRKEGLPVRAIYTGVDPQPTTISINPESKNIKVDEWFTISYTIEPSNANKNVTWKSSNPSVATVSTTGKVHGVNPGQATITVTTVNNLSKKCEVTVTDNPAYPEMTLLSFKYENENLNSLTQADKLIVQATWKNIGETAEVYTQLALVDESKIVCYRGNTHMFNKNEEVTLTYELPLTNVKPGQYTSKLYWLNNEDNIFYCRSSWKKSITIVDTNSEVIATTITNNALIKIARKQGWIDSNATQMTKADAEKITDVSQAFAYNKELISFDEFEYFTGVKELTTYNTYGGTFAGCENLKSIKLPNTITTTGDFAFVGCISLTNITLPPSLTTIGEHAFVGCISLTNIMLPPSLTTIGEYAFAWSGLASITLPPSLTTISASAFEFCRSLTNITLPPSIKTIEAFAFAGTNLTSITLPASLTTIGAYAFAWTSLTSISLPSSITKIEDCTFADSKLTSITLPSSIISLGDYAFAGCSSLKDITIPYNVSTIGCGIVAGCSKLTQITVNSSNQNFVSVDGVLFTKDMKTIHSYPSGKGNTYTIPNGVTTIFNHCFQLTSLTSVTLPSTITSIGGYAFHKCNNLTSVIAQMEIPPSIDEKVFWIEDASTGKEVFTSATLYVPKGTKSKYQQTESWNKFTQIIEESTDDIKVTSISISKVPSSINVGEIVLLTAEVEPDNATDKTVTWSSSALSVASVNSTTGVLVAKSPGTATITCKANDGSGKSAQCMITVQNNNENPCIVGNEDNTTPWWDVWSPAIYVTKSQTAHIEFTNYTNKEHKWNNWFLVATDGIYAQDANYSEGHEYFTLSANQWGWGNEYVDNNYKLIPYPQNENEWSIFCENMDGAHIIMDITRKGDAVKVSALGSAKNGTTYMWTYDVSGIYAETACFFLTIEKGHIVISKSEVHENSVPENTTIATSSAGYATFYSSESAYTLPNGLSAQVVTGASNSKLTYRTIADGSVSGVVPEGTAVMLVSDNKQSGTYTLTPSESSATYSGTNLLRGSDKATTTTGDGYHYKLSYGRSGSNLNNVFGWYWGANNGGEFQIEGHKAWLVVPKSAGVRSFSIDGDVTGIDDLTTGEILEDVYFDLQGRRINKPAAKGIYVRNGKKVMIR